MELNSLKFTKGSMQTRNRVGRGIGSGNGKTSGRGQKDKTLEVVVELDLVLKEDKIH